MAGTRKFAILAAALADLGAVLVVSFTPASGLDYRAHEYQSLQPGLAPEWIVTGTYAGLVIVGVGLIMLLGVAIVAALPERSN